MRSSQKPYNLKILIIHARRCYNAMKKGYKPFPPAVPTEEDEEDVDADDGFPLPAVRHASTARTNSLIKAT